MSNQHGRSGRAMTSLTGVSAGKQVRVFAIDGGHKLRSRLAGMGLIPGAKLKVIKSDPLIIVVNGVRMVLGRGMACKINVR
ncbi:FeoA family protein [Desulfonema magnum]|uniref:FeoA family protein n=1 Tax=Desulfonema magnum TaxID=45655 RepID=UPI001A9B4436|nr:FeoA domain-containing protein [Desulfonema magnum]